MTETADAGPAAQASGGSSLFDTPADSETATEDKTVAEGGAGCRCVRGRLTVRPRRRRGEAAVAGRGAAGGRAHRLRASEPAATGSLFDIAADEPSQDVQPAAAPRRRRKPRPSRPPPPTTTAAETDLGSGGSLFDIAPSRPRLPRGRCGRGGGAGGGAGAGPAAEPEPAAKAAPAQPEVDLSSGGSLFDIAAPRPAAEPEPEPVAESPSEPSWSPGPLRARPTASPTLRR